MSNKSNINLTQNDYSTISLIQRILNHNAENDESFRNSSDYKESITFLDKVRNEISFFTQVNATITNA